jgi:hypothetical protein
LVTITVNEVGNQDPVLDPIGNQVVYETVNLNLIITASDPDGDSLTISATGLPTGATFVDNLDGTAVFDFTPDYDQSGDYNITFKAFDGILVDSEMVTVSVLNTNRDPVLDPIGPQALSEGGSLNLIITSSDADGEIPILTTSVLPSNATFLDNLDGTGAFDFNPDFTQAGVYPITFYASDGVSTDSELVSITVGDAGNQAPVLDSIGERVTSEGANLIINVTASDPDGDIPTLTAINLPTNATFLDNLDGSGVFDFTPDFTQAGVYGVTFIADDGVLADSEYVMITVNELGNQAPIIDSIGPQIVNENDTLVLDLSATDPEGQNILFSFATNQPMLGITLVDNLDGTAVLTYMPDFHSAGVDTVRIFATDDGTPPLTGVEAVEIVTADLNQPPVVDSIGPFKVKSGRILAFTVTAHDSTAADGSSLYLTASGVPANATFADNGDGTGLFTFAPVLTQTGILTVRFTAIDDGTPAMSSFTDVEIEVVASNQPPDLSPLGPQMVIEDQTLTLLINATDPDGTIPTLSVENLPENALFEDSLNGVGVFTFTPSFVQSGLYGVIFRAEDGIDVDKETVLIQVVDAGNQAPLLSPIGPQSVTETLALAFSIQASDPDETIPAIIADFLPSGATLVDNGDGTADFTWIPGYTDAGLYDVYFMADDGELIDTEVVVITVDDIGNQNPVLNPIGDANVDELITIRFTITSSDVDMVVPLLSAASLPGTSTFTDNLDFTGTFEWVTGYDDAGIYDMTFYATDGTDAGLIDSQSMQITISNVNRAPIIYEMPPGQTTTVDEGGTLVFTVQSSDADGDPPIISMDRMTIPNFDFVDDGNGNGTLTITPDYMQAGLYSIIFIAHDGDSANYPDDSSTMNPKNFIVNDIAVAPILEPIGPQTVTEGGTLVLGITATHPGGGSVDVFADNVPENAVLFGFGANKSFTFNPSYVQAGVYNVLFYATDNIMADSETVTITVLEAGNQAPYFEQTFPDTQIIAFGDFTDNHIVSVDPDLDPITLTLLNPPANTVFVDSGNGAGNLIFTPDNTQIWATFSFRIIAEDINGAADTLTKWIRVVAFMRGDANSDNEVNLADVSFLVDYIFRGGDAPLLEEAADANFDEDVNISDALYLINYIFRHGPPPPL